MIDASTFSNSYHAFWNSHTPTCEHFVRRLNMGGLRRFAAPLNPHESSKRRALVAEYAFSLFVAKNKDPLRTEISDVETDAWRATKLRLEPFIGQGIDLKGALTIQERTEVNKIETRLGRFFADTKPPLILRPVFAGCGYLDSSEGDVISSDIIYEIKSVYRQVRSADIRQIITYAALNYVSRQFQIGKMGLFNPRGGYYFHFDVDFICAEIAGTSSQELFMTIIDTISSGDISR